MMPGDARPSATSPSDAELIQRIQHGDLQAFEHVYRSLYEFLVNFATGYVGSQDVARDIVSDIFVTVWSNRATWAPGSIKTYLCGAVRNRALNEIRNDRNRTAAGERVLAAEGHIPGMGGDTGNSDAVHRGMEQEEEIAAVWQLIEQLPATQREAMMLRWRRQLPFEEIAAIMGVSKAAVHMHLSRALKALRSQFQ